MVQQTLFPFKLEKTSETPTAHGGLALLAEFNQSMGLDGWVDKYLPGPGSNRGFRLSVFVNALVLMLQGGGAGLEDLRELDRERGLLSLLGDREIPDPGTSGDWLRRMGDPGRSQAGLWGLDRVRTMLNRRVLAYDPSADYTRDMDATQIESWKRESAFTYQGVKGYMPMLGYLSEPGDLFSGWDKGYMYYAVASNWPVKEKGAYPVLQWHNQRGQAESYHKELKIGFGMEKMPCGESDATAVYFRIGVIAYNLFIGFKRLSGPRSWVSHTIATFRWKLIQAAGRIVRHAGRVFLKLAVSCEQLSSFHEIRHRCFDLWVAESG